MENYIGTAKMIPLIEKDCKIKPIFFIIGEFQSKEKDIYSTFSVFMKLAKKIYPNCIIINITIENKEKISKFLTEAQYYTTNPNNIK